MAAMAAVSFGAALLAGGVAAQTPNPWWARYAADGQAVKLAGGRTLHLYCEGQGAPVVILDSGLGDGASSWRRVQDQIAARTRVCSYDRAGYGMSPPGPLPRDTKAEAGDLWALLKAAHLPGPYLLVAHSMGSFNVRMFAYQHPKDVAAMVLVDPSADNQMPAIAAAAPSTLKAQEAANAHNRTCAAPKPTPEIAKSCAQPPPYDLPPELAAKGVGQPGLGVYAAIAAEMDAFTDLDSKETVAARRSLGAIPLIVLTAADTTKAPGASPDESANAAKVWSAMHDDIAALSAKGVNRTVVGSGHYIQFQKPQIVIDAVGEAVDAVRTAQGKP
jgi:pimeloyl-ACP methyl ester carboxylesterase